MYFRIIAPLMAALAVVCCFAEEEWHVPKRAAGLANPVVPDSQSLAAGKIVYRKQCQSCHGAVGKGDGPGAKDLTVSPADLSDSSLWSQSDGELFWKISEGKKPTPAFSKLLRDEQSWHLVNYIRKLPPRPPTEAQRTQAQ